MTTLLEQPAAQPAQAPSQRLRTTMAAVRLAFTWFGTRKTLTAEQKARAADAFDAEGSFLSAGKKLLDTRHPAYKTLTAVRGRIASYWRGVSLPFPEPGTVGGNDQNVSRVEYTYYEKNDPYGNLGDLKTVQVYFWSNRSGWTKRNNTLQYYAYYKEANSAYCQGMLKAVVGPESYNMMRENQLDPVTSGPRLAYSDLWIEYYDDSDVSNLTDRRTFHQLPRRVKTITTDRGGRKYSYRYNFSSPTRVATDLWVCETTETRPDESTVTVYTNLYGETLARMLDADTQIWIHYFTRNPFFPTLQQIATPAATRNRDFQALPDGTFNRRAFSGGRVANFTYLYPYSSGTLTPTSYLLGIAYLGRSDLPDATPEREDYGFTYVTKSGQLPLLFLELESSPATSLFYRYQWTDTLAVSSRTTVLPEVPADQLGSGKATNLQASFDRYGFPVNVVDERGVTTQTQYYATVAMPQQVNQNASAGTKPAQALKSTFVVDEHGRTVRARGPKHSAVVAADGRMMPVQRTTWTIYDDIAGGVISAMGYGMGPNDTLINPVSISYFDRSGRAVQEASALAPLTVPPEQLTLSLVKRQTYCRLKERLFNAQNQLTELRTYYAIGSNKYYREQCTQYDPMFRPQIVVAPDGTATKTEYEGRGLPVKISVGIAPTFSAVAAMQYDNGKDGGNGNVTTETRYVTDKTSRVTVNKYTWRDQLANSTTETQNSVSQEFSYDRAARPTNATLLFQNNAESGMAPKYDERGRVYSRQYFQRDVSTGFVQLNEAGLIPVLQEFTCYDDSNQPRMKLSAGGMSYTKFQYDGFAREISRHTGFRPGLTLPPDYAFASQVTANDVILEQTETQYDEIGQPRQLMRRRQPPPSNGQFVKGDLRNSASIARSVYAENFYDPLGRIVATAFYGTDKSLAGMGRVPRASDSALVRLTTINDRGEVKSVTDPKGNRTTFTYDDAGRVVQKNEAGVRIVVTNRDFGDDRVTSIEVMKPGGTGRKSVAQFFFGPQNAGGLVWSLASNSLLACKVDAAGAATLYGYDLQGEVTSMRDPRGVTHEYEYDAYARRTHDRITSGPNNPTMDLGVRLIQTTYDVKGRPQLIETYSDVAGKHLVVQVQRFYSFFDQVDGESQIALAVPGADGQDYHVRYLYVNDPGSYIYSNISAINTIRPVAIRYPSGRWIGSIYDSGADDALGRVSRISELMETPEPPSGSAAFQFQLNPMPFGLYAAYGYFGVSDVYSAFLYPDLSFNLDGRGGKSFGALDSLDRLKSLTWNKYDPGLFKATPIAQFTYDYDRNSCQKKRGLAISTLAFNGNQGETFCYDPVSRLEKFTQTGASPLQQQWQLDPSGNWQRFSTTGSQTLDQQRTPGPGDRIQSIQNARPALAWAALAYDAAGNATQIPQPLNPQAAYQIAYDGWNQPTKITDGVTTIALSYDGLGRLVFKNQTDEHGELVEQRRFIWSKDWQLLEEHVALPDAQINRYDYVWGIRGPDDLVCRLSANERLQPILDATGNVRGLTFAFGSTTADSVFQYDAYGRLENTPEITDWRQLYCGYYRDPTTGLYLVRNRIYHPLLGRWLQTDPAGLFDSPNLYEYVQGNPANLTDPSGEFIPFVLAAFFIGGAIAGAIQGWAATEIATGGEASLGEQILGSATGGLFGFFNPAGEFASAAGSAVGYWGGRITGAWDPVEGMQWGGLAGGLSGGFASGFRRAASLGWKRAAMLAGRSIAPEIAGAVLGGVAGAIVGGNSRSALLGAQLGLFAGGFGGGLVRASHSQFGRLRINIWGETEAPRFIDAGTDETFWLHGRELTESYQSGFAEEILLKHIPPSTKSPSTLQEAVRLARVGTRISLRQTADIFEGNELIEALGGLERVEIISNKQFLVSSGAESWLEQVLQLRVRSRPWTSLL